MTRELIIREPDELDGHEFLSRSRIWLKVLETERDRQRSS